MRLVWLLFLLGGFCGACSHTPLKQTSKGGSKDLVYDKNKAAKDYHFLLGRMHSLNNQGGRATQYFNKSLNSQEKLTVSEANIIKLNLAKEYMKNQLLSEALPILKDVIQTHSHNVEARQLLASLYLEMGKNKEALEQYEFLRKLEPFNPAFLKAHIAALLRTEKFKKALEILSRATKAPQLKKSRHEYYHLKALVYFEKNRAKSYFKVERELKKALKIKPNFFPAVLVLNKMYEEKKHYRKQRRLLLNYLNAVQWTDKEMALTLIRNYAETGKKKEAIRAAEKLTSLFPTDRELKFHEVALLIELQLYQKGIDKLKEFVRIYPEWDRAKRLLIYVYLQEKREKEALEVFYGLSEGSPAKEDLLWAFVDHFLNKQEMKKALRFVQDNRLIFTEDTSFLREAMLLSTNKKPDKAFQILEEGLEKFPQSESLNFYLGTLYGEKGDFDKMVKSIEKVIEINPDHFHALNHLAYSFAEKRIHLDRALVMSQRALNLDPENPIILDTVGWVFYQKGQWEQSRFYLEKAVKKDSGEAIIVEHLGDVYLKLNFTKKAVDMYKKALELENDDKRKAEIQDKLSAVVQNKPKRIPTAIVPLPKAK